MRIIRRTARVDEKIVYSEMGMARRRTRRLKEILVVVGGDYLGIYECDAPLN